MRDIKKPSFMKDAESNKTHNIFLEICIALLVFLAGSVVMSIVQAPAMMIYLFNDSDYMKMITSANFDITSIMNAALNIPEWMMIVMLISEILLIAIVVLYCRFIEKRKVYTLGFVKKGAVKNYLLGMLGGAVAFSAAYLICIVSGAISFEGVAEGMMPLYIIGYFAGYLVQGMAEEVLCRGYLFVSLTKRCHVTTAVVVSALFFAGLHGMNAGVSSLAFLNLFLFGVFAALLLVDTGSIWMAGAFHSLWNFAQGNLYGIQVSGNKVQNSIFTSVSAEHLSFINGGSFGMEGGIGVTIVLAVAIAIVLRRLERKGLYIDSKEQPSYAEREFERISKELDAEENLGRWNPNTDSSRPQNNDNIWKDGQFNAGQTMHEQDGQQVQNPDFVNMNGEPGSQNVRQIVEEKKKEEEENRKTNFDENYFKD